jgi:hypothetical protein
MKYGVENEISNKMIILKVIWVETQRNILQPSMHYVNYINVVQAWK